MMGLNGLRPRPFRTGDAIEHSCRRMAAYLDGRKRDTIMRGVI
jgi:hypothetical protein